MSSRVSPTQRLRVEIDELFAGGGDLAGAVEQVARLGAQLLLQAALEAEITEHLGLERYGRQAGNDEAREGMRNGYCPTTIKTRLRPLEWCNAITRDALCCALCRAGLGGVDQPPVGGSGCQCGRLWWGE